MFLKFLKNIVKAGSACKAMFCDVAKRSNIACKANLKCFTETFDRLTGAWGA